MKNKQTHKICPQCRQDLSPENFYVRKSGRLNSWCKKCSRVRCQKNTKRYNLAKLNITLDEYYRLCDKQNNLCAICGRPETVFNQFGLRNLCVDHDHITGKFRGLLCSQCNHLLGNAKDSIGVLLNAIRYLEKYRE